MASRKADLESEYKKCIDKAALILGINNIDTIDVLYDELNKVSRSVAIIESNCDICFEDISLSLCEGQLQLLSREACIYELEEVLEKEERKNGEDIQNILLKVKEVETILKNSIKDEELQKVVEEINELEASKEEIEGRIFSLKTALETLYEASTEIHRDFVPALNEKDRVYTK
jgi:hypothetical protein